MPALTFDDIDARPASAGPLTFDGASNDAHVLTFDDLPDAPAAPPAEPGVLDAVGTVAGAVGETLLNKASGFATGLAALPAKAGIFAQQLMSGQAPDASLAEAPDELAQRLTYQPQGEVGKETNAAVDEKLLKPAGEILDTLASAPAHVKQAAMERLGVPHETAVKLAAVDYAGNTLGVQTAAFEAGGGALREATGLPAAARSIESAGAHYKPSPGFDDLSHLPVASPEIAPLIDDAKKFHADAAAAMEDSAAEASTAQAGYAAVAEGAGKPTNIAGVPINVAADPEARQGHLDAARDLTKLAELTTDEGHKTNLHARAQTHLDAAGFMPATPREAMPTGPEPGAVKAKDIQAINYPRAAEPAPDDGQGAGMVVHEVPVEDVTPRAPAALPSPDSPSPSAALVVGADGATRRQTYAEAAASDAAAQQADELSGRATGIEASPTAAELRQQAKATKDKSLRTRLNVQAARLEAADKRAAVEAPTAAPEAPAAVVAPPAAPAPETRPAAVVEAPPDVPAAVDEPSPAADNGVISEEPPAAAEAKDALSKMSLDKIRSYARGFGLKDTGTRDHASLAEEIRARRASVKESASGWSGDDLGGATLQPTDNTAVAARAELVAHSGEERVKALEDSGKLTFVDEAAQLPDNVRKQIRPTTTAVYDPTTGRAYVIANRTARGEAVHKVLHEIGTHAGLEDMLGTDAYGHVLKQVEAMRDSGNAYVKTLWDHVRSSYGHLEERSLPFLEEVVAALGENKAGHATGVWQRIKARTKLWLTQKGFSLRLTDADVAALVRGSLDHAAKTARTERTYALPAKETADPVTETPAFKRWFGESKVVDEQGKPLVAAHQSWNDFTVFDRLHMTKERGRDPEGLDRIGNWFTEHPDKKFYGPKNYDVYLAIRRPLIFTDEPGLRNEAGWQLDRMVKDLGGATKFREELKRLGHDGVKLENTLLDGEKQTAWIALEPEQIKSATDNRGTFDPHSADIRESRAPVKPEDGRTNNDSTDAVRVRLGDEKRTTPIELPNEDVLKRTRPKTKAEWDAVAEEVKALANAPPTDVGVDREGRLLNYTRKLANDYQDAAAAVDEAAARGDVQAQALAEARLRRASDKRIEAAQAASRSTTDAARAMQLRTRALGEDFSLASLDTRFRDAVKGRRLTPKETQLVKDAAAADKRLGGEIDKHLSGERKRRTEDVGVKALMETRIRDLEKQIADTNAAGGDVSALLQQHAAVRKGYAELYGRKLTAEQRGVIRERYYRRQIADVLGKIQRGEFDPVDRETIPLTPEAMKLQAQLMKTRNDFNLEVAKARFKTRPAWVRAFDRIKDLVSAGFLLSLHAFGKLFSAVITRFASSPVDMMFSTRLNPLLWIPRVARVAEMSPRFGSANFRAVGKGAKEGFTTGVKEGWQLLTTGTAETPERVGAQQIVEHGTDYSPLTRIIGTRLHQSIKQMTWISEFNIAKEMRLKWEEKHGADMTDRRTIETAEQYAKNVADAMIFKNRNIVSDTLSQWHSRMLEEQEHSGEPDIGGVLGSTALKGMIPIVNVPTNISAELLRRTPSGLATGLIRAIKDAPHAGRMTPEAADSIMRQIQQGTSGTLMMAAGIYGATQIGGFYFRNDSKNKHPEHGKIATPVGTIPRVMTHSPQVDILNLGATIVHVADYIGKHDPSFGDAMAATALATLMGLQNQPLMSEMLNAQGLMENPKEFGKATGEFFASRIPGSLPLKQLAQDLDTDAQGNTIKRAPRDAVETIESAIPFLREDVPRKTK